LTYPFDNQVRCFSAVTSPAITPPVLRQHWHQFDSTHFTQEAFPRVSVAATVLSCHLVELAAVPLENEGDVYGELLVGP